MSKKVPTTATVAPELPDEQLKQPKKSHRLGLIVSVGIVSALVLASGGFVWWYKTNLQPVAQIESNSQLVQIEEGESSTEIAETLASKKLIKNAIAFRLYLRQTGVSSRVQAGVYRFNSAQKPSEIAQKLASGDTAVVRVTVRGGMRLAQVQDLLISKGFSKEEVTTALSAQYTNPVLKDKPAEANLEGYLFPDTYFIDEGRPLSLLIEAMLENTNKKLTPEIRGAWSARGLNINQGLTLASIVEKEAATASDRRQVAQVFYKRLGMPRNLESDVTFQYGAGLLGVEPTTEVDSPYNTYLNAGLPPGPICMPELTAIEAVANPASTDWLFFIADKQGNVHYALDEAKHKENIEKYLQ